MRLVDDATLRPGLMGLARGSTAVALIYSKLGKRSGAHLNPATTFTFFRLEKIKPADALFYVAAQFAGAISGVYVAGIALGGWLCFITTIRNDASFDAISGKGTPINFVIVRQYYNAAI